MPSIEHEDWAVIIGRLIVVLTQELHMPIKDGGMATCRRPGLEKGLESDRCYWFENEHLVRGKKRLDLSVDPPPDLSLEIEVTRGAEAKLEVYAALRVPEVWRFDGADLTVHQLESNGEYIIAERSGHFSFLPLKELVRFVLLVDQMEQNALEQTFREWVRQQIASGWGADARPK
jgi:Uma2 family endonuclease